MTRLWISVMLLCLLFCSTILNATYLHNFTETLACTLEEAEENILLNNRKAAIENTQRAKQLWEDHAAYLHVTLKHSDIDQITLTFQEVQRLLTAQEQGGEYHAANAQLILRIRLLFETEEFSLKNLL